MLHRRCPTANSPRQSGGWVNPTSDELLLRGLGLRGFGLGRLDFGVLAAEALDTAGGVHQLLFAGEERVARGADFHVDIALMRGAGEKSIAAGAMHAHLIVGWMNSCLH